MGKGVVPAPWVTLPPAWSLDGVAVRAILPSPSDLVAALLTPEDKGGDLQTCLAFTAPLDRHRIVGLILEAGGDAPEPETFAVIADQLVEAGIGWHRWEAEYVWAQTMGAWRLIDGEHLGRGVDIMGLPPGRATAVAYAWWHHRLGRSEDEWKKFTKDMTREPRRVVRRQAAVPMNPDSVAQLQGLIGGAAGRRSAVPESTIRMPDQIP